MVELDSNNVSAIIGVLGTLIGVVLGSILNRLSRIGRIKTFQNSLIVNLNERDSFGGAKEVTKVTDKTDSLEIEVNFDFFNTSATSPKIARDINFLIKTKTQTIREKLKNENTRRHGQYFTHADDLVNVNLSPREIFNYKLAYFSRENFQETLNADWFIEYRNDKNRLRRIKIDKRRLNNTGYNKSNRCTTP